MGNRTEKTYRFIIIGAGFGGAATAYFLKEFGENSVLILEKETTPGFHSSGRNASLIRHSISDPVIHEWAAEGMAFLKQGKLASYRKNGSFIMSDEDRSQSAADFFPWARGRGKFHAEDGVLDVPGLLDAYLAGTEIRLNCEVKGWKDFGEGIRVETSQGTFETQILVNAAGAWAGEFGHLPIQPTNRHVFVGHFPKQIPEHWPFVWDDGEDIYFRPESGGLLMSPCDETFAKPGDYREDPARLCELKEKIKTTQPALGDFEIQRSWVGQRVWTEDRRFVVGFDPRCPRFFWMGAFGGHGVTCSPSVGKYAAELLLGKRSNENNPFDPARLL